MKGVSQKGHLMAVSPPGLPVLAVAWLTAQEKARMAPGSDMGLPAAALVAGAAPATSRAPPCLAGLVWSLQKLCSAARALWPAGLVSPASEPPASLAGDSLSAAPFTAAAVEAGAGLGAGRGS